MGGGIAGLSAAWRLNKRGLQGFRSARDEPAGRRQFPLGRERSHCVSLGGALRPGARAEGYVRSRTVRRTRRTEGWRVGRTRSVLLAAGALVLIWPVAGRHRARDRLERERSRAVPPSGRPDSPLPRVRGLHDSDGAWALARAGRSRSHSIQRVAARTRHGFANCHLVHELLLPR